MSMQYGGQHRGECPGCGVAVRFSLGASRALVCPSCRTTVVRSGEGLHNFGKVADLVPTEAPIPVGATVKIERMSLRVLGRVQLDHGHGPWDEWYVSVDAEQWGWLAHGQGTFYLTFATASQQVLPAYAALGAGMAAPLNGVGFEVTERRHARVVSAEGELPPGITPGGSRYYADAVAPNDGFATVDYGAGHEAPTLYLGRSYAPNEVTWKASPRLMGEVADAAAAATTTEDLPCPNCGGAIPPPRPDARSLSCRYCSSLLDLYQGTLHLVAAQEAARASYSLPLGATGTVRGEAATVVGIMTRSVQVHGKDYGWAEYLLHTAGGYRWLVEDSRHWTLSRTVSAADVQTDNGVRYQDRPYRLFNDGRPTVRYVLGEFYWRVRIGDVALARDFIHPPYLVSWERTEEEEVWSHGEHIPYKEIAAAFGVKLLAPLDVGAAEVNPWSLKMAAIGAALVMAAVLCVAMISHGMTDDVHLSEAVRFPKKPEPRAAQILRNETPTADWEIDGESVEPVFIKLPEVTNRHKQVRIGGRFEDSSRNDYWWHADVSVINEATGEVFRRTGPAPLRGDPTAIRMKLPPGDDYVLRLDLRWASRAKFLEVGVDVPAPTASAAPSASASASAAPSASASASAAPSDSASASAAPSAAAGAPTVPPKKVSLWDQIGDPTYIPPDLQDTMWDPVGEPKILRREPPPPWTATIDIDADKPSAFGVLVLFGLLCIAVLMLALINSAFETRRWNNSSVV